MPSTATTLHIRLTSMTRNRTHAATIATATTLNTYPPSRQCPTLLRGRSPRSTRQRQATHQSRPPARLHDGAAARVLAHGAHVVRDAHDQARQAQQPKNHPDGERGAQLEGRGPRLEVEADDDGAGHDGHVDSQAQPGEEGALVGAVVARLRGHVGEEEGAERPGEDGGAVGGREGGLVRAVRGGVDGDSEVQRAAQGETRCGEGWAYSSPSTSTGFERKGEIKRCHGASTLLSCAARHRSTQAQGFKQAFVGRSMAYPHG